MQPETQVDGLEGGLPETLVTGEGVRLFPAAASSEKAACGTGTSTQEIQQMQPGSQQTQQMQPGSQVSGLDGVHSGHTSTAQVQQALQGMQHAPAEASPGKRCRQCNSHVTPMWRNDNSGNKTLCNACGVKLARKNSKDKQNAQARGDPPKSLIAGKAQRARTSPAKLSKDKPRRAADLLNKQAASQIPAGGRPGVSRSPTVKRKQAEPSSPPATALEEPDLKRFCDPCAPPRVDVMVHSVYGSRHSNCTLHTVVDRLAILRAVDPFGAVVAESELPPTLRPTCWDPRFQAMTWRNPMQGSTEWSILFPSQASFYASCKMVERCHMAVQGRAQEPVKLAQSTDFRPQQPQQNSSLVLSCDFQPIYRATDEDLIFLGELNEHLRKQSAGDAALKGAEERLCAPVEQITLERLIDCFQGISLKIKKPLSEKYVDVLCAKCPWAPNRVVARYVFSRWSSRNRSVVPLSARYAPASSGFPPPIPAEHQQTGVGCQQPGDLPAAFPEVGGGYRPRPCPPGDYSSFAPPELPTNYMGSSQPLAVENYGGIPPDIPDTDSMPLLGAFNDPLLLWDIPSTSSERRRSPGEEHSDQTTDQFDMGSLHVVQPENLPALNLSHMPQLSSAFETGIRSESPITPTSKNDWRLPADAVSVSPLPWGNSHFEQAANPVCFEDSQECRGMFSPFEWPSDL